MIVIAGRLSLWIYVFKPVSLSLCIPSLAHAPPPPMAPTAAPPTSRRPPPGTAPDLKGKGCATEGSALPPRPQPPPSNTQWSTPQMDPDLPRFDTTTSPPTMYGNPEAYAQKYPHTWEANEFRQGKYAPLAQWKLGHLDPLWRDTRTLPNPPISYAQAAAPPNQGKGKRGKKPPTAQGVATASRQAFSRPRPPLPQAERRFFSSRTTLSPHPEAKRIMARIPDIAARVPKRCQLLAPLILLLYGQQQRLRLAPLQRSSHSCHLLRISKNGSCV
jgi:hypothetical protein